MLADTPVGAQQAPLSPIPSIKQLNDNYVIKRLNVSKFRVVSDDTKGAAVVFETRGLGWKIVGIDLPLTPKVPPS